MVLKHNKRPFGGEESCQPASKHNIRRLNFGPLASFVGISSFTSTPEDFPISALSVAACQEMPADDTNSSSPPSLSWHTCNAYEEAINLESPVGAFFFPYFEDDHRKVGCKHMEEINSSVLNYPHRNCVAIGPNHQADTPVWRPDEFKNYLENSDDSEDMPADDNPSSTLSLSWNTSNTFEEDTRLESPVGASFIPYYEDDCQIVGDNPLEETSSSAFDYPHRKPVAIGPDYQADIPVLRLGEFENSVGNNEDSNDKWIGTCILPMPEYETLPLEVKVRHCKNMCNCLDQGSIRCVRQHIVESGEKLEQEMGHEKFMMLGFGDMGEVVAQNWSAEEEQAFQKVVLANPASLDKNFWDDLHHVFILRSTKELVSYYFNVFMLRKRAEQNRMDPMNADSDNDEWQESDESVSDDGLEDSLVECPNDGDDVPYNDDDSTDILEETGDLYACNGTGPVAVENDGPYDVPEDCNINKLKSMSDGHSSDKNLQ
ncbi:hypothetical protein J5N97_010252 [Dioscorea zingiberensis]|uniref:ELM2 domain-containing protein n=1 Tax=Dioscorea zingiberensis TaxID=325984 RepID=A0A9D5CZT9_9LILI|nr:hypothetical protein J5N97_010252 [Dioscorea zingiberensis]